MSTTNMKPIFPVILILVGLGVGFFGGVQYKNYQLNKARAGFAGGTGTGAQRFMGTRGTTANGAMRGGTSGTILSMDDKSVTVKLADGSSKIVLFGDSTTYTNTVDAAKTDLKVGETLAVFGSTNSDGSITATTVQINPKFQMNFGANQTNPTSKSTTNTNQNQPNQFFDGPPPAP